MELKQYTALLWRWKWLIVLATLLAAGAAYGTSRMQVPTYRATTTLMINQAPNEQVTDYTAILTSERLARTYVEMLTNRPVLEEVILRLGATTTPEALAKTIDVQLVRDTQLITVSVEHFSPAWAAAIANSVVEVFAAQNEAIQESRYAASKESLRQEVERVSGQVSETEQAIERLGTPAADTGRDELARLQSDLAQYRASYASVLQSYEALRVAEARSVSNVVQVEPAVEPTIPVRPRTMVNTLLAAVVGAMLAVGVVFLIEYLDDTIKTPDEVMRATQLPLVGLISRIEDEADGEPYAARQARSPAAEAFRSLRTNLQFSGVDRPVRSLLVTSPGPQEGKSTVAANLAVVMAQGGHRVTLLDADMRRPRLHRLLGVPNRIGLSDLFTRNPLDLDGAVRPCRMENLSLLTSGGLPPNPAELLASERMIQILDQVAKQTEFVVIDSPPAGAVTDAIVLAARVDGVLLVVEPKHTRLPSVVQVVEQLRRAGANVVGLVFNNVPLGRSGYYNGYYSGYYYQYVYPYGEDGLKGGKPRRRRVKVKK
jgi:non-specific protein-tyrosine kinase